MRKEKKLTIFENLLRGLGDFVHFLHVTFLFSVYKNMEILCEGARETRLKTYF